MVTQVGDGLRARMVAVLKEHLDPAIMEKFGVGALRVNDLLDFAKALPDPSVAQTLSAMVMERFIGPPDMAARARLALALDVTDTQLQNMASTGVLDAAMQEKGVTVDGMMSEPQYEPDRQSAIARAEQLAWKSMPWETVDSGVSPQASLSGIEPLDDSLVAAVRAVRAWVFDQGKPMVILTGVPGCGKSHILQAAGNMLMHDEKPVLYRVEGDIFGELSRGMSTNRAEEVYEAFATVPYFIWDDLGRHADTPYKQGLLDRLVDDRYRHKLPTLIGTNLKGDQLPERAASRLRDVEVALSVGITAGDYRQRPR